MNPSNTTDINRYIQQVQTQQQPVQHLSNDLLFLSIIGVLAAAIWFGLHVFASYENLKDHKGIHRLTWLFAIWMPFGLLFYWSLKHRGRDDIDEKNDLLEI